MTYSEAAPVYFANNLKPIPVEGKRPVPAGCTGRSGTVTERKVHGWISDAKWGGQNVALRAEGFVALDVDHYDDKRGADQLADLEAHLGPLPATISSTSRGVASPSRQYFFALPEPVELHGKPPIFGVAPKDVHIEIVQAHHRYAVVAPSIHPDTGAQYAWYDADGMPMDTFPSLADFEYLPEAWIDYLRADERVFSHSDRQWDGEIPEIASEDEGRKVRTIISRLNGLPDVWAPGAGWHDTVFAAACWLSRIAHSNAYALTEDRGYQLLLEHTPTYPDWGTEKIEEQWASALKITEGQFEEPPGEPHPPLLLWTGFPTDREFPTMNGDLFVNAWKHRPESGASGALWGQRQKLLTALLKSGFSDAEAATVVWHSRAAAMPVISFGGVEIPDGDSKCITIDDLWKEVGQAKDAIAEAAGQNIEAAPVEERPEIEPSTQSYQFISEAERALIAGPDGDWFGRTFVGWARDTFGQINEAYYRMNRWALLSVIFGTKAVLPFKMGIDRRCNLYIMVLGPTTSGKSTALAAITNVMKVYYLDPDDPDVGGDFTPESLAEVLINRDGLPTFMRLDEAHETFSKRWKKEGSAYSGMPGVLTDLYDGEQRKVHRITRKETSGKRADVFLTLHLMGTYEGMVDVIEPSDWTSGLMPRFVWGIGRHMERTRETMTSGWITEDHLDGRDDDEKLDAARRTYQQWAAEFAQASQRVSRADGRPSIMALPRDVMTRWGEFRWTLTEIAQSNRRHTERLEATYDRLAESTLRAAALVALSRGRLRMEMGDLLIAIEQAEEWATNAKRMVVATEESLRDRRVNALEKFVFERGGVVGMRDVHLKFPNQRRMIEDFIGELIAQGRVERDNTTGADLLRLKGITERERKEMAA